MAFNIVRFQQAFEQTIYPRQGKLKLCVPKIGIVEPEEYATKERALEVLVENINSGVYEKMAGDLTNPDYRRCQFTYAVVEYPSTTTCTMLEVKEIYCDYYNDETYTSGSQHYLVGPFDGDEAINTIKKLQDYQDNPYDDDDDDCEESCPFWNDNYYPKRTGHVQGARRVQGPIYQEQPAFATIHR